METNKAKRNRKPLFSELTDSLQILCRAEKAGALYCSWISQSVGSYGDAQTYLGQLAIRTHADNPVIAMLARQAMRAR